MNYEYYINNKNKIIIYLPTHVSTMYNIKSINNRNILPIGYLCGVIISKIQIIIKTEKTAIMKNILH